jgi:hypothetical protein
MLIFTKHRTETHSLSGVGCNLHHNNSTTNKNRSYEWAFREYIRPFKVVINWLASVIKEVAVSESVTFEIFRNGSKVEE